MRLDRASASLVACLALGTVVLVPPPAHGGSIERLAVQHVRDALAPEGTVVTHPLSDAIEAMRFLDEPLPAAAGPALATRAWILERASAFGLDPLAGDLRIERDEARPGGGRRVRLRQLWRGVPVEGADVTVVLSARGRLRALASNLLSGLALTETPRIGRTDAIAHAARGTSVALERAPAEAELWVRRTPGGDRLAWRVALPAGDGPPRVRWVDAESGTCTEAEDAIVHAVGLVYPTDPRQPLAEVPLERLLPGSGLWNLDFRIEDLVNRAVEPLGPNGDYRFPPTQLGFDQVNAYWHSDRFLRVWLGALGYPGPPESLLVRVNYPLPPNVAITSGRYIYYGLPIVGFCREPARADDILVHELGHALLYGYGVLPGGPQRQANALHEALADYFAAAVTGDPAIGEWLYLTFPSGATRLDMPVDPWHARNYDNVSFGGAPGSSSWANGMILSCTLWDLRAQVAACDSLVFESLEYLPGVPNWAQFANALLQADEDHHGGIHRGAIVAALGRRGIRGAVVATIEGPLNVEPGAVARFTAEPCCDGAEASYRWRARSWCRGAPCSEWRALGEGRELESTFDEDAELALEVESAWGERVTAVRFVGVRLPQVVLEGPSEVVRGREATWSARISAMAPFRIQWLRRWQGTAGWTVVGEGAATTFAVSQPCEVGVLLIDGLLRHTTVERTIALTEDRPPPDGINVVGVRQRSDARGRAMETTVELPRNTPLRMRVYDVRGRLRAKLWDGPASRGAHVVRWDAASLEPGVYLLRVEAEPTGTVVRFSIVR